MRFTQIFTAALAASGFAVAIPGIPVVGKRSLGSSQALNIINAASAQVAAAGSSINQTLVGITPSSPSDVKAAAAQKVTQQLGAITAALGGAASNVTQQGGGQPVAATSSTSSTSKRQNTGDTTALINAIGHLITNIDDILITIVTALGIPGFLGPFMEVLATISTLILSIAAVVVDILPFLGDIGQLLSGIGSIISGVGSVIPK